MAEASACGARAGAAALALVVVLTGLGLLPGAVLNDDMDPRMNRLKFSQSMAGISGYEGHADYASIPFF